MKKLYLNRLAISVAVAVITFASPAFAVEADIHVNGFSSSDIQSGMMNTFYICSMVDIGRQYPSCRSSNWIYVVKGFGNNTQRSGAFIDGAYLSDVSRVSRPKNRIFRI